MFVSARLSPSVYDILTPRPFVPTADWACRNLIMPPDSNIQGPFRLDLFPYMRDWFEAFDDPMIRQITIQAASRTGKTSFTQACLAKTAVEDPHPMAFADADQFSTERVIDRTWRLFEGCREMRELIPPKAKQSSHRMDLTTCVIHGAWAGSTSTAADYAAYVAALNETDKMKQKSTDTEAHFCELMGERVKGWGLGSKLIVISTPTLKDASYIERQRLMGDNRRRLVPCPHCGHFQALIRGDGTTRGGVKFEKLNGKIDPQKAEETAFYQCENCLGRIEESQRPAMLRAGLWVPEGCQVSDGKVIGQPVRRGRHASFGPLGSLHSMLPDVTFGTYAAKFATALSAREGRTEAIRNFTNSWDAETWDPRPAKVDPPQLIERMGIDEPLRVCPIWSRILTVGVDVGQVGDQMIFYWLVSAWGLHLRGQLVDYGIHFAERDSLTEFRTFLLSLSYPHADAGDPLVPIRIGVDSGSFTNTIYEFCEGVPNCFPVKGSKPKEDDPWTNVDVPEMFSPGLQRLDKSAGELRAQRITGQWDLIVPNTTRSQNWIEDRIQGVVKPDADNWYSIPTMALAGQAVSGVDLPRHLLGDFRDVKGRWRKAYKDQDFRDALRYSMVMAWHYRPKPSDWSIEIPRVKLPPRVPRRTGPSNPYLITDRR